MKARVGFVTMVLILSICTVSCKDDTVDTPDERPNKLTFAKYYEPYKSNIEPNASSYRLPLDLNDIVNFNHVGRAIEVNSVSSLIRKNGFAVLELPNLPFWDDVEFLYKNLSNMGIPVFVTTDILLHIFHIQYEWALREIEEREFAPDINDITIALLNYSLELYDKLDGDLREATRRNIAYLSVAQKLITPDCRVSELVADTVARELAKIESHTDSIRSDIFIYQEDYTQYVPRSHYAFSDKLQRYFKTMMWYGRMTFLLDGGAGALISKQDARIQTLQAFLLAASLDNVRIGKRTAWDVWDRIHKVLSFFLGVPDDLTPHDYLLVLNNVLGDNFELTDISDPRNFQTLKTELDLLPSPKILGSIDDPMAESLEENLDKTRGMRLFGQRFVPDSYMFQRLVYPKVGKYNGDTNMLPFTYGSTGTRCYPRGLDLMALLGSQQAKQILIDEGDSNYVDYWSRFGELTSEFDQYSPLDWNQNLYWSWLYTLKSLINELPEGYPQFMRTKAWLKHQLHTTLASWTELRHDTNLYAKMSGWPAGLMRPSKELPPPPGYVEPVPVFWGRLLALTRMTISGLTDLDALSPEATKRLNALKDTLGRLVAISAKELQNQKLSEDEHKFIKNFGANIEPMTSEIPPTHLKTTLIADVHTYGPEGLVVEEAVGKLDLILVAFSALDGSIFLAVGPVLSYYEFKHPMSDRLTDESWQLLLDSPDKPDRPKWYVPLMRPDKNSFSIRPPEYRL